MIRIRMGESLVISNISSTKHIQFMMVEDRYNLGQAKFIRLYNNSINQDKLESSRKFSQRQDAKLRKQSFHLNTQLEPKLHDFTLPIRKVRDAQKNRPSWWKRIMNFITGNAA